MPEKSIALDNDIVQYACIYEWPEYQDYTFACHFNKSCSALSHHILLCNMAGVPGLEPGNPGIKTPCLNQLGYTPIKSSTSISVLILNIVCARIIPGVLPSTPLGPVSHTLHCSNSLPANLSNLGIRGALPRALASLATPHLNLQPSGRQSS